MFMLSTIFVMVKQQNNRVKKFYNSVNCVIIKMMRQNIKYYLFILGLIVFSNINILRAETGIINLHLNSGPGFILNSPYNERYDIGGDVSFQVEWAFNSVLGVELNIDYTYFPSNPDYNWDLYGLQARDNSSVLAAGGGLRLRILNDNNGYLFAWRRRTNAIHHGNLHGNLYIEAIVNYVRTGELNRFGITATLGYEFSLIDGFQIGPFVKYNHIFQPDTEFESTDGMFLVGGISLSMAIPSGANWEIIPDTDGDNILDPEDQCKEEREDYDRFQDNDGCPDSDNDNDNVLDVDDHCINEAEDRDGFQDNDGCPDNDNDNDNIADSSDQCRDEPEDIDNFEDNDGCIDIDNDNDRIYDYEDRCPDEAEIINGVEDDDGCPDEAMVKVEGREILLDDRIYYDFGMARIKHKSYPLLKQIARLINSHSEYKLIRIEGHCDEIGTDEFNNQLSQKRADSAKRFLEMEGVSPDRLISVGYGKTRPLREGNDDNSRQLNRRVEFRILIMEEDENNNINTSNTNKINNNIHKNSNTNSSPEQNLNNPALRETEEEE